MVLMVVGMLSVAAEAQHRKTILIVFDEDRDFPGLSVINASLRETFKEGLQDDVEFCSESLNLSQFRNPDHDSALREYFRRKYAGKKVDLVVAVMQPSLDFLLRDRQSLFPGVPIVFCGIDSSYLSTYTPPPNVTGVAIRRTFAPTLEIALRLKPDTQHVYVVSGTGPFDEQLQVIARRDFARYEKRVAIHYLTTLTMSELLARLSNLPARSVVIHLTMFRDGAGRSFIPHEALAQITARANAPVFVAIDQYLDRGAVGGHVYSVSTHGRQAAQLGLRILRGETPPVTEQDAYKDAFDWRQLQRWGLDEKLLPPGSEIRNRTPSLWQLYKGYIVAGISIVLLQSALIIALLVSHMQLQRANAAAREAEARRKDAEEESRRQRDELAHALRVTTLGELAGSLAHEIGQPLSAILINAKAVHRLVESKQLTAEEVDEALGDIEDDAARAAETIQQLRALFRKERSERKAVDLNVIIEDVVRLLRVDMTGNDIHIEFHRAEDLPQVVVDPIQLRQVVLNLLVNAEDALTRERSGERKIHVETAWPGDGAVELVVRDNGSGATDDVFAHMFERFVSTKPDGLGMGLAISRSIVEAHDGRIWATRNEGRGLSLHVQIPV